MFSCGHKLYGHCLGNCKLLQQNYGHQPRNYCHHKQNMFLHRNYAYLPGKFHLLGHIYQQIMVNYKDGIIHRKNKDHLPKKLRSFIRTETTNKLDDRMIITKQRHSKLPSL